MLKKGIDYDYDCYGFDLLPYCCLCIIEAILGFVIAACAAIILPVIVLLLLYIVFMILFG